jgi:hypothetical protein
MGLERGRALVRLTRRGRLTITLTVTTLVIVTAYVTYAVTRTSASSDPGAVTAEPPCHIDVGHKTLSWSHNRALTATTVAAVGRRIGATDNSIAAAVARSLRGRHDRQVDAAAAREVYRGLPTAPTPSRASRELSAALLGKHGPALTCTVQAPPDLVRAEPQGTDGLTPRAETVRIAMRQEFGKQILGGFAPGGVQAGHIEGSAHYEGRAIDIFFRPISAANQQLGWQQAQWAVAHADRLQLATIIFDRQLWSAEHSTSGWREYVYADGPTENPVLLHEDHVHVDVLRGLND